MLTVLILVYLASVFSTITGICTAFAIILGILMVIWWGISMVAKYDDGEDSVYELWKVAVRKNLWWWIMLVAFAVFLPSKSLMYIAAGLETTNVAMSSDLGKKAYSLLEQKLDDALLSDKKDDKDK